MDFSALTARSSASAALRWLFLSGAGLGALLAARIGAPGRRWARGAQTELLPVRLRISVAGFVPFWTGVPCSSAGAREEKTQRLAKAASMVNSEVLMVEFLSYRVRM